MLFLHSGLPEVAADAEITAKPVVKVNPDQPVFIGETVTLTCDTQTGENTQWIKYSWIKNSSPAPGIGERVYEITSVSDADAGQYSCELSDISSQTSVISAAVTLTVSERPKPVVNVSPDQRVFIGETVTLTCDIQTGGNIQWTKYSWIKDGDTRYQYYPQTKPSTVDWSFRADSVYFGGQYSCRGERSDSQTSDISDAVTLTVSASPRSTVTVTPDSAVFTGETVNLKCVIKSDHSDWTYEWFKDSVKLQSSDGHYTVNRDTLTIRGAAESDRGHYWCRRQRSGRPNSSQLSSAVSLSVTALPVVKVSPDQPVFIGETVTLTCDIQTGENIQWTYSWNTNSSPVPGTDRRVYEITSVSDAHAGQYSCGVKKSSDSQRSVISDVVTLTVSARPKPVVNVRPDQPVFIGETVTLTCHIQPGEDIKWIKYSWIKDGDTYNPHRTTSAAELSFRADSVSVSGQYSCRGERSDSQTSDISDAVTLTVSAVPTSIVSVTPDSAVFTGETVSITCNIVSGHGDWKFVWYNDRHSKLKLSDHTVIGDTLTIRGAAGSDQGHYWCGAQIRSVSTQSSSSVYLYVKALPTSTLYVTPDSAVFTGETVNLQCVIESHHNDWTYEWHKDRNSVKLQSSSGRYTVNRDTLTIRGAYWSDQGQYWCRGQRSGRPNSSQSSSAVYLSVTALPSSRVTVTPASAVFTGETVKLKCVIEPDHSDWTYVWYKDTQRNGVLQTSKLQTLTLTKAAEYNQGQYWCKGQRSRRPNSSQLSSAVYLNVTHLKPKLELRSDPAGAALTGNTVTLTCNTDLSTGWDFYWYKNTQDSEIKMTRTNSYSMKIDSVSDGGQYWCRAGRGKPVYYTQYSDELTLSVTGFPKAVVTVWPDEHVFRGETVTLRCDIKWGGNTEWTHRWQIEQTDQYNHNNKYYNQFNQHNNTVSQTSTQKLKISRVEVFHHGKYSCTGQMGNQSSQRSDAVALTVSSDEAQAAVRVSPQPWLTEGHSVTLICEVPGSSTGWTFSWFRDADHLSDSSRGAGGSYTLSPAALQHTGVYTCRAERGEPAYSSQNSSAQPLWVTGVSASVRLVLRPSRSQHFSSDSLSLSCDSAEWTVRRFTHTNTQDCSAQTGSTCGIQSLSTSDTGVYWCESESGEKRHPLNITVHDGAVILESSADPVIEGETLTLHCLHRSTISSILTADFYKDGSLIQNQMTGEMSIPTVSKSDEGFYYCKTKSIESPHSWISVRDSAAQISACKIVSFLLTVCPYLSATVVLLYKIYKARAQSAKEQSQNAVAEE
ncbi:Fc receptor-like protein 5 isoform X2 [Danio rerio]